MDTHITILIGSTVIINRIHTFIIRTILIPMGDFYCMDTAIGMVITRIMEDGAGTTEGGMVTMAGGTGSTEVGMGVIKGVGKVDIMVVGEVDIMETGEGMADIKVVDIGVGTVDECYENRKGLRINMSRKPERETRRDP